MFRIIPRYTGKFETFETVLYYKNTFLKILTPKNLKEIDGHHYVELTNDNGSVAIFYDDSVPLGKEKPVLAVTDPSDAGLQKALDFLSCKC